MPEFAHDPTTGQEFIFDENKNDWVPFTGAEDSLDAFLINAGSVFSGIGDTFQRPFLDEGEQLEQAAERRAGNAGLEQIAERNPVASFLGQAAPGLATLPIGGGANIVRQVLTNTALGAGENALQFNPDVETSEQLLTGAAGGLIGDLGGRMAGRVVRGIAGFGDRVRFTGAAERLERAGGRSTIGQKLGDQRIRDFEDNLQADFLTSGPGNEIIEHNTRLGNESARRAIGAPVEGVEDLRLTADVFDNAATDLEAVFNEAYVGAGSLDMGEGFGKRMLGLEQFRKLRALGDLEGLERGIMSGEEIGTVRNALSEEMGKAFDKGDGQLGKRLRGMLDDFDNASEEIIGADKIAGLRRAREQWRVLKELEKGNNVTGGDVNPVSLNSSLRRNFGTTATRGRADQASNTETAELIESIGALADPNVRPGPTSRTATLQSVREASQVPGAALVRGIVSKAILEPLQNSPGGAGAISALLTQQAPEVFSRAGARTSGGTTDALNALIFGSQEQ